MSGSGALAIDTKTYHVDWELSLSISGELVFILTTKESFTFPNLGVNRAGFVTTKGTLSGVSLDGIWDIECKDVVIPRVDATLGSGVQYAVLYCHYGEVTLRKQGEHNIRSIKHFFNNLNEGNFDLNIDGKVVHFAEHNEIKEILSFHQYGRISVSAMSSAFIDLNQGEHMDSLLATLENLEWILSMITLNSTYSSVQQCFNETGELVSWNIKTRVSFPFRNAGFIRNDHRFHGIKPFIENHYSSFLALNKKFNMRVIVSLLLNTVNEKYPEFKIAGIIFGLEYYVSQMLLLYGDITQDSIEKMNIQGKLNRLNNKLRFIRKDKLDDYFRDHIRNPLFHQGCLMSLSMEEKAIIHKEYFELLIQILLVSVGYTGKYISPDSWGIVDVPKLGNGGQLPPLI